MNDEQMRKEFEQWYTSYCMPCESDWFYRCEENPDEYGYGLTQEAWAAWQHLSEALQQSRKEVEELRNAIAESQYSVFQLSNERTELQAKVDRLRVENVKLYGWMDGSEQWYKRETDKDKAERQKLKAKCAALEEIVRKLEFYCCHAPNCKTSKAAKKHELADCTCGLEQALNKASKEV